MPGAERMEIVSVIFTVLPPDLTEYLLIGVEDDSNGENGSAAEKVGMDEFEAIGLGEFGGVKAKVSEKSVPHSPPADKGTKASIWDSLFTFW